MDKKELLFYNEYEAFYRMAKTSVVFGDFCREAFGGDFSQDGFSNIEQINMILPYIPKGEDVHILDIGCGNGKMAGYLQKRTNAFIHGFDYSENAISTARELYPGKSDFCVGVIGGTDYPEDSFDVIISMDTMYFAPDMTAFTAQVKKWLKRDGVFFVGYQEGDVMPKTENIYTTVLSNSLAANGMRYEARDITMQTYELLKTKRRAAEKYRSGFEAEGHTEWYELLIAQTDYAAGTFEQFCKEMARYIYIARK